MRWHALLAGATLAHDALDALLPIIVLRVGTFTLTAG
jgi:hypothetical protein